MTAEEPKSEPLIGSDLILLLIAAPDPNGEVEGRLFGITRLEKLLFIAEREGLLLEPVPDRFTFSAYHYGPYSKDVYEAVDLLEEIGLLREERVAMSGLDEMEELETDVAQGEGVERRFFLTLTGAAVAGAVSRSHPKVADALAQVRQKYGSLPLNQLLAHVYRTYPDMVGRSRIKDQILGI